MSFTTPLEPYKRSNPPQSPEGQLKSLQEEMRKLERTLEILIQAATELEARLTAGGL
jgi:hypothetical protein